MIKYEKEICAWLHIPSVPLKTWDGKTSFKQGVGVIKLTTGDEAYAAITFDTERHAAPMVTKVFSLEPYTTLDIERIFVVPSYMDTNVAAMDLDEDSKIAAQRIIDEAEQEISPLSTESLEIQEPKYPWIFPEIHTRDEAEAWVRAYRKKNKIKGKIPQTEEALKLYLEVVAKEKENSK